MTSRRVLMIAFHYPPVLRSSGVHRTAKFVQYLPENGWQPLVLTVHPRAYMEYDKTYSEDLPGVTVKRAFALDTAKHLAVGGKYLQAMALPDRWASWALGAVPAGMQMIRRFKPDLIWSTYPIATAHKIAHRLHQLSGLPWVADFRDPMTDEGYPSNERVRRAFLDIEANTVRRCSQAVFTTPDTLEMYKTRFTDVDAGRFHVIANGFDEETFARVENEITASTPGAKQPLTLLHAGLLYRSERNPEPFFAALGELKKKGKVSAARLRVVLRASGDEAHYRQRLEDLAIADMVELAEPRPYGEALREMLSVDGLLLFQAANCNHQIPAKAYEYLRAKRPMLALTDHAGNTAQLLRDAGIDSIVDIADQADIEKGLEKFLDDIEGSRAAVASDEVIQRHSRRHHTRELAAVFEQALS